MSYQTRIKGPYPAEQDIAWFSVYLERPYEIVVNEEYYLYDMISIIGAIGGTMGLCIGLSFKDLARDLVSFLKQSWEKIAKLIKRRQTVEADWRFKKEDSFTLKGNNDCQETISEEMSEMTNAEMRAILKKLQTKMDKQQAELKQLRSRYDDQLIDIYIRLSGGIFKTERWPQQKEWETKMDRQQTELKQLLRKHDEKLIEMDIRLRECLGKDSD